jgi:DNA-binding NarL/FixJ family response regulator
MGQIPDPGPTRKVLTVRFTRRERLILRLLCEGFGPKEIADELEISPNTAHTHLRSLCSHAGVTGDRQLIIYVWQHPQATSPGACCPRGIHRVHCGVASCPYCSLMYEDAA